ncbi:MAG: FkbM family methyltransferase [Actinomycetes bacterium]
MPIDSVDDLLTLGECFGKLDYRVEGNERLIVDAGANIGVSALYFLSHAPESHVVCIEPDPRNVERLERNLARNGLAQRATIVRAAIGSHGGTCRFAIEKTGRYGTVIEDGKQSLSQERIEQEIVVESLAADQFLNETMPANGRIDVLKLDVEGQELPVLEALSDETLSRIGMIYAEIIDGSPTLPGFRSSKQGTVVRYTRK